MTENESIKIEREPHVGAAVILATEYSMGHMLDVAPSAYIGNLDGNYSFIRPTSSGSIAMQKTPKGFFGRSNLGITFYSPYYELEFTDSDEEGFESLVSKLRNSDLARKK